MGSPEIQQSQPLKHKIFKKIFQAARVSSSSYGLWISMDHVSMSELKCHHSHMHGRYDARYDARNDAGNDDARRGGMGGKRWLCLWR